MLLAQWGRYGVQLVSLVLLARLLDPQDFGLVAMATAVTGLAAVIGDFGLSLAALQAETLDQRQRSNLFWLNTALGVVIGAIVMAAAPAIAALYGDQRIVPVVVALGVVFVLNGLAVQFSVELNRTSRFGTLGGAELAAQAGGLVLAIAAAVAGLGYWSLVVQQIGVALILLAVVVPAARWLPTRPARGAGTRALLTFGRDTFAVQVTNYVTSNLDTVLIGRVFGSVVLGLYNRAFLIVMLPVQQIAAPLTRVFLPRLSRLGDNEFLAMLERLQRLVIYALLTPLSLAAAVAAPALAVVLGPEWASAGPLLQVLAIGGAFQSAGFVYYWAFLARKRTGDLFRSELLGRLVMVVLMFALVGSGPIWVAASVALGQALIWLAAVVRYGPRAGIASRPLLAATVRPVAVLGSACAGGAVLVAASDGAPDILRLLAGMTGWVAVFAGGALVSKGVRLDLRSVLALIRRRPAAV